MMVLSELIVLDVGHGNCAVLLQAKEAQDGLRFGQR